MGTAQSNQDSNKEQKSGYKDRPWIPRFWDGMCVSGWFPLLFRNGLKISPSCIGMAVLICILSFFNVFLWAIQFVVLGRKINRTKIQDDPIFVIGHWRSGTTLLHELLVLDSRHSFADTYACFAPNHFLASGWIMRPCLRWLLPTRRPMDNMAAGWDRPQEDEFALCNMGVPSPYLTSVFPNNPPQYPEYLDLRDVPPAALTRWKAGLLWFLKCITAHNPKRIVLKSPPHTARVKTLLEMFPQARFVHIIRDPYVLFSSTMNLWKRLYRDQGLQVPNYDGLEELVFATLTRMYDAFERDRPSIGPGQFCEVRYEDLVANPVAQMQGIYEQLKLGEFESVRPAIEQYFAKQKDYKTNRFELSPETRAEITRRWSKYITQYGYGQAEEAKGERQGARGECIVQ